MGAYIVRRLLQGLFIIWGVYTLTFFGVAAAGDPFTGQENAKIGEEELEQLRKKWGYDKPPLERYFTSTRKIFWADPDEVRAEGAGIEFVLRGDDDKTYVSAFVQTPPESILLKPTIRSARDEGAEPVTLTRDEDGTYAARAIKTGDYRFGVKRVSARGQADILETQGVRILYDAGQVRAEPLRAAEPPQEIVLTRADNEESVRLVGSEGTYGEMPVEPGRYGALEGAAQFLVEEEALSDGGLTFDLGRSLQHNRPVWSYLKTKLWNTLKLAFWALLINYLVGITLGVFSAIKKDKPIDHTVMVGAFFLYSMPGFWLALMLQLVFAVQLGWLPLTGMGEGSFLENLQHFVMPVFVLGVAGAAGTARYQRSAVLEVLGEDYVRTARAKGVDEKTVIRKHVLRNALLPIITLFGLSMPFLVSGAVITEQVFSWPGMGQAVIDAINNRDTQVVTAITLMGTVMVVLGNLLADVAYAVADPRVRLS